MKEYFEFDLRVAFVAEAREGISESQIITGEFIIDGVSTEEMMQHVDMWKKGLAHFYSNLLIEYPGTKCYGGQVIRMKLYGWEDGEKDNADLLVDWDHIPVELPSKISN